MISNRPVRHLRTRTRTKLRMLCLTYPRPSFATQAMDMTLFRNSCCLHLVGHHYPAPGLRGCGVITIFFFAGIVSKPSSCICILGLCCWWPTIAHIQPQQCQSMSPLRSHCPLFPICSTCLQREPNLQTCKNLGYPSKCCTNIWSPHTRTLETSTPPRVSTEDNGSLWWSDRQIMFFNVVSERLHIYLDY